MANNMNNLTTLIKRLEAATSRLEDMVPNLGDQSAATNGLPAEDQKSQTSGGITQIGQSDVPTPAPIPPVIDDFDKLINADVTKYVVISEQIGGLVAEQSAAVLRAFASQRNVLIVTTKSKKPDRESPIFMEILKDLQSTTGVVNDIREANRPSPFFNHLTTVSEGINILGWITVTPGSDIPKWIKENMEPVQYWGDRVSNNWKEKDQTHADWVKAFYNIFKSLIAYVSKHYAKGVSWNEDGIEPADALQEVQSGQTSKKSASSVSAPPPPPPLPNFDNAPPPPPMPINGTSASKGAPTADMGAVFSQISSSGEGVTSHLRKVDPSLQTHKNPSLRASSAVPSAPARSSSQTSLNGRGKSPLPGKKPESMRTKKPAKKELDGTKWIIENFDAPSEIVEISAALNHAVLISHCAKTTIRINGKVNAISLDNCVSTSLVVDSLIGNLDVIKSPKFQLQVLGTLPSLDMNQVDGAELYLGPQSLGTEISTTLCTALNVYVPQKDDYEALPVPDKIVHVIKKGKLISTAVRSEDT